MPVAVTHWDCWGSHGELEHVNKPVPNSTLEAAMNELTARIGPVINQPKQQA